MKRMGNSRLHAAMLSGERFQRGNRLFVGEDNGDLAALGASRPLTFSYGLWLGHGSERINRGVDRIHTEHCIPAFLAGVVEVEAGHAAQVGIGRHAKHRGRRCRSAAARAKDIVGAGENRKLDGFHVCLQFGPIPRFCKGYSVTSDVSTGICA